MFCYEFMLTWPFVLVTDSAGGRGCSLRLLVTARGQNTPATQTSSRESGSGNADWMPKWIKSNSSGSTPRTAPPLHSSMVNRGDFEG